MSNALGAVARRTSIIGLAELRFNFPNWGDEYNKNLRILDALVGAFSGSLKGTWEIATLYAAGDRVVSAQTGIIYQCLSAHVSPTSGTLEQDLINNPARWSATTSNASFRGTWLSNTIYNNNDFVIRNNAYYVVRIQHTAGSFADDLAAGRLILLIDINPFLSTISGSVAEAAAAADLARQYRDQAGQVANFDPAKYVLATTYAGLVSRVDSHDQAIAALQQSAGAPIKPIEWQSPAANATLAPSQQFSAQLVGYNVDTIGFYSDYGIPQVSRTLNVYTTGAPNTVFKTVTVTGAGNGLAVNLQALGLAVNTSYLFELVFSDALGNTVSTAKRQFNTPAQYKPNVGDGYLGGFYAYPNYGNGLLYDLVLAPKSTEATKAWHTSTTYLGVPSRVDGATSTNLAGGSTATSTGYAASISIGGAAAYLAAVDEMKAIASRLKPSAAQVAAFQTGGSEVFAGTYWSSSELTDSTAITVNMTSGSESSQAKSTNYSVRAIKRVAVDPPYPIGAAIEGGYLVAYFTHVDTSGVPATYMLIVADKGTEANKTWGGSNNTTSIVSRTAGNSNSNSLNGLSPAAAYCNDLVSGGKDDWYLGAIDEMLTVRRMNSQLPSAQQLAGSSYWSSTEFNVSSAKSTGVSGEEVNATKSSSLIVRPIRRVALA